VANDICRSAVPAGSKIFAEAALRQISLATGGRDANTEAFRQIMHVVLVRLTLDQFIFWPKLPSNAGFGIKKVSKKFLGVTPRTPSAGGGDPLPHAPPARLHAVRGAPTPPLLDLGLGNRSPKSKFTTTPLRTAVSVHLSCILCSDVIDMF